MDVLNKKELVAAFKEIEGHENQCRRLAKFQELDIYTQNQAKYVQAMINKSYGKDIAPYIIPETSINFSTTIVNAEASIYKRPATRTFANANEKQEEQLNKYYEMTKADEKLKTANRFFRLGNQCLIQLVPKNGALKARVLYPHQYDVIPKLDEPEVAEVIIIPCQAKPLEIQELALRGDGINQRIADINDTDLAKNKYVVYTDKYIFKCNGNGEILDPTNDIPYADTISDNDERILNPIETLPFIDVSAEKLMGYWAGYGSSLTDFSLSFSRNLTDLDETMRLQGYSQGVLSSTEEPKQISVGPHRMMWLKKTKGLEADQQPEFNFVSPSPDLPGSLSILESKLKMFLTARGTDSNAVKTGETKDYTSGVERLLAMVERSEATAEDKVLFQAIEQQYFNLVVKWSEHLQSSNDVQPDANIAALSKDITCTVQFDEPVEVQTKEQKEASAQRRLDMRLLSRKKAAMELYGFSEEQAEEYIAEVDQDLAEEKATDTETESEINDGEKVVNG